jgi:biopolymer transport protein ExbB
MPTDFNWLRAMGASPVFLVLVGCSVVTLAVAIERLYYFTKRRGDADAALRRALTDVGLGDFRGAARTVENTQHPFGAVAATLFKDGDVDRPALEERMYVALNRQKLLFEKNVGMLGTMAAISPLIGLLGTVWGIMHAFHDMALVGSAGPSVVAAGIAEALFTTAAGIIIAVPSLVIYNHFVRRISTLLMIAETNARTLRAALSEAVSESDRTAPARAAQTREVRPAQGTPGRVAETVSPR